jgi:protein-tyrosine-phosphatase
MAKPKYEYCEQTVIRSCMAERWPKLAAGKGEDETPAEFWSRVERAGLLREALELYDAIAAERTAWKCIKRETKQEFEQRLRREGRLTEAKRLRAELLASGLTQRQAQMALVERLQPLDGTRTRAWQTPDPWEAGRLFKKKADQVQLLAHRQDEEDDDEEEALSEDENRLYWAELRRDERQALAGAQRRAWTLKQEQKESSRQSQQPRRATASADGPSDKSATPAQGKKDVVVI